MWELLTIGGALTTAASAATYQVYKRAQHKAWLTQLDHNSRARALEIQREAEEEAQLRRLIQEAQAQGDLDPPPYSGPRGQVPPPQSPQDWANWYKDRPESTGWEDQA